MYSDRKYMIGKSFTLKLYHGLFFLVNEQETWDMSSIKTVAEYAHVSIATVSRVLNRTKYVSPDVEKRVLDAVAVLNYHPNAPASNLRRQRTLSIGIHFSFS